MRIFFLILLMILNKKIKILIKGRKLQNNYKIFFKNYYFKKKLAIGLK